MKIQRLVLALIGAQILTLPLYAYSQENQQVVELPKVKASSTTSTDAYEESLRVHAKGSTEKEATIDHPVTQPVTVVDQQEISQMNTFSTLDVLSRVPNVSVNRAGGLAGTIYMRGLNSNDMRIPMYIDGDRFRGRNTLQFMLIDPTELEQVEVIRGPSSSRFGSDGLGGLINFVTKRARGNLDHPFTVTGGEVGVTYRSNGDGFQTNAAVEAAGSGFDLRVYGTHKRASNYDSASGTVPNSDYRSETGGVVLGYMPDQHQRIEFSARTAYVKDGAAGTLPLTTTSRRDPLKVKQARVAYTGDFADAAISHLDASLYVAEFDTTVQATNTANAARTVTVRNHVIGPVATGGRVAATIPWKNLDTIVGLDFMHERRPGSERNTITTTSAGTTSTGFSQSEPNQYQTNIGAFANSTWHVAPKWTLTAGARYDWFKSDVNLDHLASPNLVNIFKQVQNSTETATTGSLGLSYQATDVVELLGSVGTSFRMPWTSEMFTSGYTGSSYTIPNPELKPERGTNIELGTQFHFDQATVGITGFHTDYRNFIQTTQTTYEGLAATQRQNIGKARIQGLETNWRWQFRQDMNFYGNASYLRGTNRTTDLPLANIAPYSGLLGLQYIGQNQAYSVSGELVWAKGQSRYASTEYPTGGYGVMNMYAELQLDRLGFTQFKNTQLILGISNLFDKSYVSAATASNMSYARSYINPLENQGRSFNATLKIRF